jgi:hypothetical protein
MTKHQQSEPNAQPASEATIGASEERYFHGAHPGDESGPGVCLPPLVKEYLDSIDGKCRMIGGVAIELANLDTGRPDWISSVKNCGDYLQYSVRYADGREFPKHNWRAIWHSPPPAKGTRLAKCGHAAYRHHDNLCIHDGCPNAAYVMPQPPASEPSGREAVYAKHRKRCERECTRDVIFVFQRRRLRWTGRLPDGYEFRDSFVFLKGDGRVAEPQTLEAIYAAHGSEYAIETWDVESVWLDRDEAEAWAKAHEYNYRDGWRVYGMPADGELAKLLRGEHESQRHPAAPAGEREDNTALQAKLDAVTGLEKKWRAWSRGIGKSPVAAQWAYTRCADELESALAGGGK